MSAPADDPPPDAGKLPTGRLARTARVGGLVTGQGLRWAGMRTANRMRSPERAAAAQSERTAALVQQLVDRLSQMRGAAMKVGQMISMVDLDGLPEDEQDELRRRLAALRDDVPPVPFADLEKLMRQEFGGPMQRVFSDFDERAFAAASIGQVHRATTVEGDDVAVKIQYPGVAEAVETDLRNAMLLLPLVKRIAPGLDAKALASEMRERIGEELDYELEAQNQRRIERLTRGIPYCGCPASTRDSRPVACWSPTTSRASVSRPCAAPTRRSATATARSSSGSTSACSIGTGSPSEIRIRGTTCSAPTAGSASWTSDSCATSTPPAWPASGRSPSPSSSGTPRPSRRPSSPAATYPRFGPTSSTPTSRWGSCEWRSSGTPCPETVASGPTTPGPGGTVCAPTASSGPRCECRSTSSPCHPSRSSSGACTPSSPSSWSNCGRARTGAPSRRSTSMRHLPRPRWGRPSATSSTAAAGGSPPPSRTRRWGRA